MDLHFDITITDLLAGIAEPSIVLARRMDEHDSQVAEAARASELDSAIGTVLSELGRVPESKRAVKHSSTCHLKYAHCLAMYLGVLLADALSDEDVIDGVDDEAFEHRVMVENPHLEITFSRMSATVVDDGHGGSDIVRGDREDYVITGTEIPWSADGIAATIASAIVGWIERGYLGAPESTGMVEDVAPSPEAHTLIVQLTPLDGGINDGVQADESWVSVTGIGHASPQLIGQLGEMLNVQ